MTQLHPLLSQIFSQSSIPLSELEPSSRGCYLHKPTGMMYFTKTQSDIPQMRGEIEGLLAMGRTTDGLGLVPKVLGFEIDEDKGECGMVTQYFKLGSSSKNMQKELGEKIAKMHSVPPSNEGTGEGYTGKYGFNVPTHCGVTEQDNSWEGSWEVFYRDRRLGDLVTRIGDREINKEWEVMKERAVPLLLHSFDPPPKPVIQHGDLWSGNKGYDTITDKPVIYDPASYYGHNEADLGITHMLGGFSKDFYDAYHSIHPKSQPYYDERQKLYELYHHLNHTLMFGGSYKSGSLSIMRSLNNWAKDKEM
ncbi:hypothetical protein I302_108632 [Kwoniella bestiolae CBS 10118]|uniref:protein-ribulosamine 3-kinase n=1 Tax=Kwoniella bestiolae CBS 10118 TaxID=1296100 RepID=A0A1B9FTM4_9TREE|nr:fructosamine kinase [Kwoniella bestiolae CBS 10118]OCF22127.1 fructosamine kinase [Kwoniella bestiolae CBS 10118]